MKLIDHLKNNWNGLLYFIGILVLILLISQVRFAGNQAEDSNALNQASGKVEIPIPADTTPPPEHELKHSMIKSSTWSKLASLTFRKEIINGEEWTFPVFSKEIKEIEGEMITLQGYLIPLEQGQFQQHFMISALPINQCYFCGKANGVPEMVEVHMNSPINFTQKVISIKGIFQLNESDEEHFALRLVGAEIIE